jgi:hypothetical protein
MGSIPEIARNIRHNSAQFNSLVFWTVLRTSKAARKFIVAGRQFSMEQLGRAVENSRSEPGPIVMVALNTGYIERHEIPYRGGLRGPHLRRTESTPDYLDEILKPLAKP